VYNQVAYFNFSRKLIVNDNRRQHEEGVERLREAKAFAEWSKKDREARLPPLTDEQRHQMRQYLRIVERHGISKALSAGDGRGGNDDGSGRDYGCVGCPVLGQARRVVTATPSTAAATETANSSLE